MKKERKKKKKKKKRDRIYKFHIEIVYINSVTTNIFDDKFFHL